MNRRKALVRIGLGGAGLVAFFAGYEFYSLEKSPDVDYVLRNKALLAALAERIIPATPGVPGATEAGVADFIIMMIRECTPRMEQNQFIKGLKDLQSYSHSQCDRLFQECTPQQQEKILTRFEAKDRRLPGIAGKVEGRLMGRPFFSILKAYTVEGYCTSEAGATRGLSYVQIPGSFKGCIPLAAGQRAWATN